MTHPIVVAITGATGVIYGVEVLKALRDLNQPRHLILSSSAVRNIHIETEYHIDEIKEMAEVIYDHKDIGASVASGSFKTRGMVVAPCTIKTLSAIANSFNENLVVRAADCTLKERRRLVLMVRETPLHKGHLELMMKAADHGATILPPMPSFYHGPKTVMDIVHQSVGKALDQFDIEHDLYRRWTSDAGKDPSIKFPTKTES
ncbi:MAG: UbiX family flavin prenyltransferase [Rhodospirillales bacterium]|nr:UbiX family flavin prenyltransferase [Rhodospirillales bacterium]